MFSLSSNEKYFIYTSVCDMRQGINGLSGIVSRYQKRLPFGNEVYIFMNKQKNIMKLLHYEFGGYTIYYKKLEKGNFDYKFISPSFLPIKWSDLILKVEGIIVEKSKQKRRFLSNNFVNNNQ